MMPRMRQALVEFELVEDAISCVQSCQVTGVELCHSTCQVHLISVSLAAKPSVHS